MSSESIDLASLEQRLSQLAIDLHESDSEKAWKEVEIISQKLANGLRIRDGPGMCNFLLSIAAVHRL